MVKIYFILFVLLLAHNFAFAQTTETTQRYSLYQELVAKAETHALKSSFYLNDKFNSDYAALQNNPTAQNAFLDKKILALATDLSIGRVTSDDLPDQAHMTLKTFAYAQYVSRYIAGQITSDKLVSVITPHSFVYLKNLEIFNRLKKLKESGLWATAPNSRFGVLQSGMTDSVLVPYLRQRLSNYGYAVDANSQVFDDTLKAVVAQFQADNHLDIDGVVGPAVWGVANRTIDQLIVQALLNVDRARWLPDQFPSEYIYVNLADNHFYYKRDAFTMDFKNINGRIDRQTPVMIDVAKNVVLNPTWTVPYSIFVKDKLPMIQQDPHIIERMHMILTDDLTDAVVDPLSVNWMSVTAENLHYTLVQQPGAWNALGFVKFPLTNKFAIYLHDTESRQLFQKSSRFLSSGCVRIEKPFELAEQLLDSPQWTLSDLRNFTELSPVPATQPTWFKTKRAVPVFLFYSSVELETDGRIRVLNDAYGMDQNSYRILTAKP
ncbi:MAG: L,D-transpeptidase family protein [Pseudobdellovibrio sp.]